MKTTAKVKETGQIVYVYKNLESDLWQDDNLNLTYENDELDFLHTNKTVEELERENKSL